MGSLALGLSECHRTWFVIWLLPKYVNRLSMDLCLTYLASWTHLVSERMIISHIVGGKRYLK
jgi:hypothetical protein